MHYQWSHICNSCQIIHSNIQSPPLFLTAWKVIMTAGFLPDSIWGPFYILVHETVDVDLCMRDLRDLMLTSHVVHASQPLPDSPLSVWSRLTLENQKVWTASFLLIYLRSKVVPEFIWKKHTFGKSYLSFSLTSKYILVHSELLLIISQIFLSVKFVCALSASSLRLPWFSSKFGQVFLIHTGNWQLF